MKRYEVNLQFDSELEDQDIEQAMYDFLDEVESLDVYEDSDCIAEVIDEYTDVDED